jgi:hypothetical protein
VEGLSPEKTVNARFVLLRKPLSSHELFAQLALLLSGAEAPEQAPYQLADTRPVDQP